MENNSYRWTKLKNGRGCVAIVDISVDKISSYKNEIVENYSGDGFTGQGNIESAPKNGFDSWKIAARHGLEFAFSLTKDHWRVTINSIEGRAITDTNPTTVAYTIFRAFCSKANLDITNYDLDDLEKFVLSSWTNPYKELIPDFFKRTFDEYKHT